MSSGYTAMRTSKRHCVGVRKLLRVAFFRRFFCCRAFTKVGGVGLSLTHSVDLNC